MSARLVIVAGAPGAGKTTLAHELGRAVSLPVITKDDVKEALAEPFATGDREWSKQLGAAAYSVYYVVAERILEAGHGLVLESNFRRGTSEEPLLRLAALAPTALIVCRTSKARERYAERAARGRHRVHIDDAVLDEWDGDDAVFQIDIGTPRLVVDTSDGYAPDLDQIVAFARGATVLAR